MIVVPVLQNRHGFNTRIQTDIEQKFISQCFLNPCKDKIQHVRNALQTRCHTSTHSRFLKIGEMWIQGVRTVGGGDLWAQADNMLRATPFLSNNCDFEFHTGPSMVFALNEHYNISYKYYDAPISMPFQKETIKNTTPPWTKLSQQYAATFQTNCLHCANSTHPTTTPNYRRVACP